MAGAGGGGAATAGLFSPESGNGTPRAVITEERLSILTGKGEYEGPADSGLPECGDGDLEPAPDG